jgi:hypothetical protein
MTRQQQSITVRSWTKQLLLAVMTQATQMRRHLNRVINFILKWGVPVCNITIPEE